MQKAAATDGALLDLSTHCSPAAPPWPISCTKPASLTVLTVIPSHRLLLERLIDCSFVQPYTINSAKVIFLKPRPQSRPFKGSGNVCLTCDRILQEPFHFCCLSCKVDHVMMQGGDLSNILYVPGGPPDLGCGFPRFDNLRVDGGGYDDDPGQVTPNSILEHPAQQSSSCGYGGSSSSNGSGVVPRKKKSGGGGGGLLPHKVL